MAKSDRAPSPAPDAVPGRHSVPDRRLASLFIKRATAAPVSAQRVGIVGSYSPSVDGPASFTNSLRTALMHDRPGVDIGIVRVVPKGDNRSDAEVVYELSTSDDEYQCKAAAGELNKYDVAVIQYHPGSFGGAHSEQVLLILNWIRVPVVVVIHDVPADPLAPDSGVLRGLGESADAIVTMSETARQRLIACFGVPPRKVMVIQHGAHVAPLTTGIRIDRDRRPCVLTWGLFAPGKGIEWAIEAMASLGSMRPQPRYLVAGPTHPRELAMDGDRYRDAMVMKADKLDLASVVEFAGELSHARLQALIHETDVVLIPYDSADVSASAVLVQAIGARKPVVATRFSHAVELLDGEHGGLLVAPQDPHQIAAALTRILTEPGLAEQLVVNAAGLADSLSWPTVAAQYRQLFDVLLRRPGAR